jgi:hypothetical protein
MFRRLSTYYEHRHLLAILPGSQAQNIEAEWSLAFSQGPSFFHEQIKHATDRRACTLRLPERAPCLGRFGVPSGKRKILGSAARMRLPKPAGWSLRGPVKTMRIADKSLRSKSGRPRAAPLGSMRS